MSIAATRPNQALTTPWQIDAAHTQVGFEVSHMMFAKVRGRFEAIEGALQLASDPDLAASRASVTIGTASIDTGQPQRDEHLRSADFLDAERFPEIRFESLSAERRGAGNLVVRGSLMLHGVTRDVVLEVTETGRGIDPWGNQRVGFSATTTLDRRDYGLTWNQALEAGGILVGNEVKVTLELQAVPSRA